MKNELEEQFFKVFGIKPIRYIVDIGQWDCETNSRKSLITDISIDYYDKHFKNNNLTPLKGVVYPEITDRKLLEMICILSGWRFNDVQDLEETILEDCIKTAKRLSLNSVFANQIQQLFKEGE